jgi:hypothetical protein
MMSRVISYRSAKEVPITKAKIAAGQKGKKDPMMDVWPRADWVNPGEHIPVHRRQSKIRTVAKPIPRRKKKA